MEVKDCTFRRSFNHTYVYSDTLMPFNIYRQFLQWSSFVLVIIKETIYWTITFLNWSELMTYLAKYLSSEKLACCLRAPDSHCSNIRADLPPWENNRKRGFANEVFNFQCPFLISQLWPVEHSTIEWLRKVQRSNNSMAGMEDSCWWMKLKSDCHKS